MTTFGTVLIGFIRVRLGLKSGLTFNVNHFFDNFLEAIKLSAMFFYFYPDQRFWVFSELLNHYAFF